VADIILTQKAITRFFAKTRRDSVTGCLEWMGHRNGGTMGYGSFFTGEGQGRSPWPTHRVAWVIANGPIPPGMCVCHHCDNRPCVEVRHLFLGTRADNSADMVAKKRHRAVIGEAQPTAKMTARRVVELRSMYATGLSAAKVAPLFGISKSQVLAIVNRRYWAHVP